MESGTMGDAVSWRDILMTLAFATSVLLFLLNQRRSSPAHDVPPSSEEERRKRREHLAAIAEERAAAARKDFRGSEKEGAEGEGSAPAKDRSDGRGATTPRNDDAAAVAEERASAAKVKERSEDFEKDDIVEDEKSIPVEERADDDERAAEVEPPPNKNIPQPQRHAKEEEDYEDEGDNPTGSSADADIEDCTEDNEAKESCVGTAGGVSEPEKKIPNNSAEVTDDGKANSEETDDADICASETHTTMEAADADSEVANDDAVEFESTTDGEEKDAERDTGHRERHARAIAKIMAKRGERAGEKRPAVASLKKGERAGEKRPAVASLKIHLILTSSPGSSRVELSIPNTVTAASLLRRASQASGVPEGQLKLIFRGRMITERCDARRHVLDEFGIEDGSVLHVVGKPRRPTENEDRIDSEEAGHNNSGSGRGIGSEEDDAGEAEENVVDSDDEVQGGHFSGAGAQTQIAVGDEAEGNVSNEEVRVGHFSDVRARAQIVADIRNSSGEGYYHRAAQLGEMEYLRESVDNGFSDLIRVADSNGWTPLHEAVRAGHVDVVQYLVEQVGLNINEVTNGGDGWTPLSLALEHHGPNHPVTIAVETLMHNRGSSANPRQD